MNSRSRPPIKRQYGRQRFSATSLTPSGSPPAKRARTTYDLGAPGTSQCSPPGPSSSRAQSSSSPRRRKDWTNTVSKAWSDVLNDQEDEVGSASETGDLEAEHETPETTPDVASPPPLRLPKALLRRSSARTHHVEPVLDGSLLYASTEAKNRGGEEPAQSSSAPAMRLRPRPSPAVGTSRQMSILPRKIAGPKGKAESRGPTDDIRSFFTPSTSAATTTRAPKPAHKWHSAIPQPQPQQMLLDISNRPSTRTCPACGMSYVLGVPEDLAVHDAHHKRVVTGIEWPPSDGTVAAGTVISIGASGDQIVVVHLDGLALDDKGDLRTKSKGKGAFRPVTGRKVLEVLSMVDTALGATPLSVEQRKEAKAFIYVGPAHGQRISSKAEKGKGKVVVKAVCVAARVEKAFKVVSSTDVGNDVAKFSPEGQTGENVGDVAPRENATRTNGSIKKDWLRFGEDDSAIFCSPDAYPALLGIHRIYTLPAYRGRGLASMLLTATADRFIYGLSLIRQGKGGGRAKVAFSQPTRSGRALARRWTGTDEFGVFVE